MNAPAVAILLSTYNGARFLGALLDSLCAQTYRNIKILIRDDVSTDGTLEIISKRLRPGIEIVDGYGRNVGAANSFIELLRVARADIYMFCDQDDIWLPKKVENAVRHIEKHGISRPTLYHCDLRVVDDVLREINSSFYAHGGIDVPRGHDFARLVVENSIVGCTLAITEEFVRRSGLRDRPPHYLAMHDWWLALLAAAWGEIIYSPSCDILYRQHDKNVSGAGRRTLYQKIKLQFSAAGVKRMNDCRRRIATQSAAFLHLHGMHISERDRKYLDAVARLNEGSGLIGVCLCCLRGVRFQNAYMNIAMVYSLLASLFSPRH